MGPPLPRDLGQTSHDAAVACLQLGHEWEGSRHAEQGRVAGINARDQGIRQDFGGLGPRAPADKGIDGFIGSRRPRGPKAFGQDAQFSTPAKKIAPEKSDEAGWQTTKLIPKEEVPGASRAFT